MSAATVRSSPLARGIRSVMLRRTKLDDADNGALRAPGDKPAKKVFCTFAAAEQRQDSGAWKRVAELNHLSASKEVPIKADLLGVSVRFGKVALIDRAAGHQIQHTTSRVLLQRFFGERMPHLS